jgi:hypothetical protein
MLPQDAFWTANKSVKVRNSDYLHPEGKPIALDGRLRATPAENRHLSLFFMVSRVKSESEANLKVHYPKVEASMNVDLDLPVGKKRSFAIAFDQSKLPQVPIIYNPGLVKKHTKLAVLEDIGLANIVEKQKADKLKATSVSLGAASSKGAQASKTAGRATKGGSAAKAS